MHHINEAAARKILRKAYGARKYRITPDGEIYIYGPMPNATDKNGWSLYGWIGYPETQRRLAQESV